MIQLGEFERNNITALAPQVTTLYFDAFRSKWETDEKWERHMVWFSNLFHLRIIIGDRNRR